MTLNRSMADASTPRGLGKFPARIRLALAFGSLVAIGLTQTGCRSDGCYNCDIGSKLTNGLQGVGNGIQGVGARIFNHKDRGGCSTCGTLGAEEGVIVEGGIPVATPGAIVVPAPATILPPPALESAPNQLEAIPSTSGAASQPNSSTSSRNSTGASRSAYEAANPKVGSVASRRGLDLARAYQSTTSPKQTAPSGEEPDVFDHLPPVDLPSELSRKVTPVEKLATDASEIPPASSPPAVVPPTEPGVKTSSAEINSAGASAVSDKLEPTTNPIRATPGIVRSASVAPSVAGGSLPSVDGLAWLKEKGYRTLVDLRGRAEVAADFPEQVTDNGMLYVAIPFAIDPINPGRLARFNDLLNQNDQRPLYFCDGDGRRAGLLWYLRLRSKDHEEATSARAKAEEIGLLASDIAGAEKFLKQNFAMDLPAAAPVLQAITIAPASPEVAAVSPEVSADPAPAPVAVPATVGASAKKPTERVSLASEDPIDPVLTWRPMAALVLSGLGVPLAYWSSSTLLQRRAPRRASLTAKPPGPRKSLPSSDA